MPKYQQSKQGYTRNPQNPAVMSDRKKAQLVARGYPHTNSVYTSPNPSEGVLKPRMDLFEDSEYSRTMKARLELPGVKLEDIKFEVVKNVLTVSGRRPQIPESGVRPQLEHIKGGRFYRAIDLPQGIKEEDVNKRMVNGVLELSWPKEPWELAPLISVIGGDTESFPSHLVRHTPSHREGTSSPRMEVSDNRRPGQHPEQSKPIRLQGLQELTPNQQQLIRQYVTAHQNAGAHPNMDGLSKGRQPWEPRYNICEENSKWSVWVELPGITDANIKTVDRGSGVCLYVIGTYEGPRPKCTVQEIKYGKFQLELKLPEGVRVKEGQMITPLVPNGILTLEWPKDHIGFH